MNEDTKQMLVLAGGFLLLVALVVTGCLYEDKLDKEYRIEALEATQDCEPCQLIILSKGSH